jgi:hypothetical protein
MARDTNAEVYEPDHPMFGKSVYDFLMFTVRWEKDAECWWVYLKKVSAIPLQTEPLGPVESKERPKEKVRRI